MQIGVSLATPVWTPPRAAQSRLAFSWSAWLRASAKQMPTSSAAFATPRAFSIGPLPVAAANTTDSSLEAQAPNAAALINGARGIETSVMESKVETRVDTAGFDADGGGGAGGAGGAGVAGDADEVVAVAGCGASQVSVSKSESSWASQVN